MYDTPRPRRRLVMRHGSSSPTQDGIHTPVKLKSKQRDDSEAPEAPARRSSKKEKPATHPLTRAASTGHSLLSRKEADEAARVSGGWGSSWGNWW